MKQLIKLLLIGIMIIAILFIGKIIKNDTNILNIKDSITSSETESSSTLTKAEVIRVVDGDTIIVKVDNKEKKVRLTGVDTPESVSSDESKNCPEGKIASTYTKSQMTAGRTVYLQYDKDRNDKYGRELCYVWTSNKVNVNAEEDIGKYMYNAKLLENGMAHKMIIEPNTHYKKLFATLEKEAKANDKGFWKEIDQKRLNWN